MTPRPEELLRVSCGPRRWLVVSAAVGRGRGGARRRMCELAIVAEDGTLAHVRFGTRSLIDVLITLGRLFVHMTGRPFVADRFAGPLPAVWDDVPADGAPAREDAPEGDVGAAQAPRMRRHDARPKTAWIDWDPPAEADDDAPILPTPRVP